MGLILIVIFSMSFQASAMSGKGRELYKKYCSQCHEPEQGDWNSRESRSFSSYVMRTPGRELKQRIQNGGKLCPSYFVIFATEDVEHVVDYIKVLR